jgi:hypothetical protein
MLVLALQFSTSGRGRAPSKIDGAQASGDGDLELSSSSGAALPRGRGRSGLTAAGRVLPQNGTVMPDAAGPGGATCARERRGVGVVDGPISQRST